ncbi:hypothetical protein PVAP13_4NG061865 [Panicum virgatum]|uniref:Uncharacterized protein n=1 Tax=Panicum virgatum TaxID=38727 RepID=A0A8T0TBJ2_PANVG|nr:hypothetical protein PVAP13_4NG061865 [Panicum virgatum]
MTSSLKFKIQRPRSSPAHRPPPDEELAGELHASDCIHSSNAPLRSEALFSASAGAPIPHEIWKARSSTGPPPHQEFGSTAAHSSPNTAAPQTLHSTRELSGNPVESAPNGSLIGPTPLAIVSAPSHPGTARPYLRALLSSAAAPIKTADGSKLRRARSLPSFHNQCFRCLATDHHVEACRDPVRCRQCLRYGHRSGACSMVGQSAFWARIAQRAAFTSSDDSPSPPRPRAPVPLVRSRLGPRRSGALRRSTVGPQARELSLLLPPPSPNVAPSPVTSTIHHPCPHRARHAATPFFPVRPAPPAGDDSADGHDFAEVHMPAVDMEPCRRLAYAFVEPECADPGLFIRTALEQRGGDPPVRLAASSYGSMMVVFRHLFFREETLRRGPLQLSGHILRLVCHEEADFRFVCRYRRLAVLAATNFPPEHWTRERITRAFHVYGQVCCVDKECLETVGDHPPDCYYGADIADYSAVRVLVLLDNERIVKPFLVVRNLDGGLAGIARVRVVKFWAHPDGAPLPNEHDFSDWGDDDGDAAMPGRATAERFDPLGRTFAQCGRSGPTRAGRRGAFPQHPGTCRALGPLLFPSVPLWTLVAGAMSALGRTLSLAGVPQLVIRDLPTPVWPATPPPPVRLATPSPPPSPPLREIGEAHHSPSGAPSLEDILLEEEHKSPFYVDATSKVTRVKAAQLDLTQASARMKEALTCSGILQRPAPPKITSTKLRCLARVCGIPDLPDEEVGEVA